MQKNGSEHQNKKFFLNNFVEALIPFKEEHQGLLKLHLPLGWEFQCGEKMGLSSKEWIFFKAEK